MLNESLYYQPLKTGYKRSVWTVGRINKVLNFCSTELLYYSPKKNFPIEYLTKFLFTRNITIAASAYYSRDTQEIALWEAIQYMAKKKSKFQSLFLPLLISVSLETDLELSV